MDTADTVFLFAGLDIFLPANNLRGTSPAAADPDAQGLAATGVRRYGRGGIQYEARFLSDEGAAAAIERGYERVPVRQAIGMYAGEAMQPALTGLALLHWLAGALRCGACGAELADAPLDGSKVLGSDAGKALYREGGGSRICTACGREHFPRISPAVIVLVRRGDEALLARNARFPPGRFGLLAGFVEPGETLEQAAAREVREESGIEIKNLRYRRSQPWPFPDSLMLAFTAEWASGEAVADGEEISELRWCTRDDLPGIPPPGSVARSLIDEFVQGAEESGG
jgi:NAD+ diphosphatase